VRIAHTADIHIRGLTRHDEYRALLQRFTQDVRSQNADALLIAGDVFHSKISGLTPEYIELFTEFLRMLSRDVELTFITLGNHDGNLSNLTRLDSVSPIVTAVGAKNIICCRDSGAYALPGGYSLHVFSLFDRPGWSSLSPSDDMMSIATYHGPVAGAMTDIGWHIDDGEMPIERFAGYKALLLGDIHKHQVFERSGAPWGAYPGSLIQQNFGEDADKGYLVWDFSPSAPTRIDFRRLSNPKPFITLSAADATKLDENGRYRIVARRSERAKTDAIIAQLKSSSIVHDVIVKYEDDIVIASQDEDVTANMSAPQLIDAACDMGFDIRDRVSAAETLDSVLRDAMSRSPDRKKWSLRAIRFDNVLSYGADNFVSFDDLNGIVGLFAPNGAGKSSFVGAITYVLLNEADRNRARTSMLINKDSDHCFARAIIDVDGVTYAVERQTVRVQRKDGSDASQTQLNVFRIDGDMSVDACGEQRSDTEKILRSLIGDPDDCKASSIATQGSLNKFIDDGPTARRAALARTLGLSYFDDVYKTLVDRVSEKRAELRTLPTIDISLELKTLRDRREQLRRLISKLTHEREELLENQREVEVIKARIEAHAATSLRAKNLRSEIQSIKNALDVHVTRDRSQIAHDFELASRAAEERQALSDFQSRFSRAQADLRAKKRSLAVLSSVPCGGSFSTCQFIRDAASAATSIPSDELAVASLESQRPSVTEYNGQSIQALRSEMKAADDAAEKLANRDQLRAKMLVAEKELESLSDLTFDGADAMKRSAVITSRMRAIATEMLISDRESDQVAVKIERLERDALRKSDLLATMHDAEQLAQAFSKRGVPLRLLKSRLDIINARVSELLETSSISARAIIDADELQIEIENGPTKVPVELACGMEKFFVALAFRMAMAKLSPSSADFFIIDEGFGSLDEAGLESACKLLSAAKSMFSFIIVVSHVDYVKDVADHALEVTTDASGRSKIRARITQAAG